MASSTTVKKKTHHIWLGNSDLSTITKTTAFCPDAQLSQCCARNWRSPAWKKRKKPMGPTWEYSSYYKAKTSSHTWTDRNSEWMPHWLKPGMPNIHINQLFIFWLIFSHKGVKACFKQVPLYFKLFYHLSCFVKLLQKSILFILRNKAEKLLFLNLYTILDDRNLCQSCCSLTYKVT